MEYRVRLTRRAERDLEYLCHRLEAAESSAAARWLKGLEDAIATLERFPFRCPVVPESRKAGRKLRHLLYAAKRDVYRVLFEVDESRRVVTIMTVRHSAMDRFIGTHF